MTVTSIPSGPEVPASASELNPRESSWQSGYASRLRVTDALVLIFATATAGVLRFGADASNSINLGSYPTSYMMLGIFVATLWWVALTISGSRDQRIVGHGAEEYTRVAKTTVSVFGMVAIFSLLFKLDASRGYLAIAFPLGLVGLLAARKSWRNWLGRERARGRAHSRVLVVGGVRSAKRIAEGFIAGDADGYRVTGVWVPDRQGARNEWLDVPTAFIPVMGTQRSLVGALSISEADTVIVTDTEHLGHDGLKDLAWQLEGAAIDLMVSPNVFDVAGPRIHVRGVSNMPFIHLERPTYAGAAKFAKSAFDKTFALLFLVTMLPLLLAIAVAVKLDSPGAVLYRSERIGVGGRPFFMLKFRSMAEGADRQVADLSARNEGSGPLFKMRSDPRVTRVGRFLRRYSLDELPQFINVLRGDMSVVGPRPPLGREVEQYNGATQRRLLVKQGITGLWQISGRSDLTWEETVRLDLDYVENWSMLRDLQIVWRTLKAVTRSEGAY
ncbi:polyprenyl glycosylphosphotransferase [Aeromicrobium sp. Root472D3]|nr:polyprenyl glycosylphosphotransferase [Aeromicrobium sp. Root472D3]